MRTMVPILSFLCAAVALWFENFCPEAVAVPKFVFTEYQDILPRWVEVTIYFPSTSVVAGLDCDFSRAC